MRRNGERMAKHDWGSKWKSERRNDKFIRWFFVGKIGKKYKRWIGESMFRVVTFVQLIAFNSRAIRSEFYWLILR